MDEGVYSCDQGVGMGVYSCDQGVRMGWTRVCIHVIRGWGWGGRGCVFM